MTMMTMIVLTIMMMTKEALYDKAHTYNNIRMSL